jgi:hypothetical protein
LIRVIWLSVAPPASTISDCSGRALPSARTVLKAPLIVRPVPGWALWPSVAA